MGINPFEDDEEENNNNNKQQQSFQKQHGRQHSISSRVRVGSVLARNSNIVAGEKEDAAIWSLRAIDWAAIPSSSSLSSSNYIKLRNAARQLAIQFASTTGGGSIGDKVDDGLENSSVDPNATTAESGYAAGIAGFMTRVLTSSNASGAASSNSNIAGNLNSDADIEATRNNSTNDDIPAKLRKIRAPNSGCVASSNGWVLTVLEVGGGDSSVANPLLRLVSRWNVRRGNPAAGSTMSSGGTSAASGCNVDWSSQLIPLPESNSSVSGIFLDPTGTHAFISCRNGTAYYLHSSSKRVKVLTGFFGSATSINNTTADGDSSHSLGTGLAGNSYITSIAWDLNRGTESFSQRILLGTNQGEIFGYVLCAPDFDCASLSVEDLAWRNAPQLLHNLDSSSDSSSSRGIVSGLYMQCFLGLNLCILAVTCGRGKPTRLHSFVGTALNFQSLNSSFVELPGGSIDVAHLVICPTDHSFVVRTEAGLYYGKLELNGSIVNVGLLPYESSSIPLSIAITPHHYMYVTADADVCFVNRICNKIVQRERVLDNFSYFAAELFADIRRPDQVWLRHGKHLLHISSTLEDRDVWKFSLEKCLHSPNTDDEAFDLVKALCTKSTQKDVVAAVRAEYHLARGLRPHLAAKYLATVPPILAPFSATALRLALPTLGLDYKKSTSSAAHSALASSNTPLILYLMEKLRLASDSNDSVQCVILGAWIVELLLHERGVVNTLKNSPTSLATAPPLLSSFLLNHANNIDAETTIRILANHDVKSEELVSYAAMSGDISTAVSAALSSQRGQSGALHALNILNEASMEKSEPIFYKYALLLLCRAPSSSSKSFLTRYAEGLAPTKLLPSLMQYETRRHVYRNRDSNATDTSLKNPVELQILQTLTNEHFVDDELAVVKYLEGVIQLGCRTTAIFNYLLSLYASMEDEAPLFRFLCANLPTSNATTSNDKQSIQELDSLDMSYALRIVLKTGRHFRSAVKLYMGFGLRQQAVELALKVDPSLARELARESMDMQEKKRLWLMIAKNAATDEGCPKEIVRKVIHVIKEAGSDILSIQDVLPFLPDVAQIDQFKDEICDALTQYASRIEEYKMELADVDHNCDKLRDEVHRLKNHDLQLKTDAKCFYTSKPILQQDEAFYIFPSGFAVLSTALKDYMKCFLSDEQKNTLQNIQIELERIRNRTPSSTASYYNTTTKEEKLNSNSTLREEELQAQYDGILAAECPLTGSVMVESIDLGFGGNGASIEEDEKYQFTAYTSSDDTSVVKALGISLDHDVAGASSTNPFDS